MSFKNFGMERRGYTARERRIRSKYASMFVIAALTAIVLGVLLNKKDMELKSVQEEMKVLKSTLDSIQTEHSDLYQRVFPVDVENQRCEMILEAYLDESRHADLYERDGFKSKFSEKERKKIVDTIKEMAKSYNELTCFTDALREFQKQNPRAYNELDRFFFFTE